MSERKISEFKLVAILSFLMAFSSLSVDIYLPAMPIMANDLNGNIELSITGFLVGFAFAQLVWGIISDNIGRKKPLFIGMLLFVIGSIGCALSHDMLQLVISRIIQAFGACTGPMIARTIIRDLYSVQKAAKLLSTLMIIMSIAPIAGPLIGGQILLFGSWHEIFLLLTVIGSIAFFTVFLLPETHKKVNDKHRFWAKFNNYLILLRNKKFIFYTLCLGFFYVAAYAFIVGSPLIYINYYHIKEQYFGWLFAINIVGVVIISYLNRFLVTKYSLHNLLLTAVIIATIAMSILLVLYLFMTWNIIILIFFVLIFFSMNGIIAACTTALALSNVKNEIVASASALMGAFQYGSGIISSLLLAIFATGSPIIMIMIMTIFTIASLVMLLLASK